MLPHLRPRPVPWRARPGPAPTRPIPVIRFHLASILKRQGWTPYRLSQETGLTVPAAYRLADPDLQFGRFTADTLDRLCAALGVQPGDLLEWVPDSPRRRPRPKAKRAARR